jgi:hypothetical protein
MSDWIIKSFRTLRGEDVIKSWIKGLPKPAQAEIKTGLRYLLTQQKWDFPHVKKLHGSKYIFEIRITSNKVRYRPLGFYGPKQNDFTLLVGAIEKGSQFEPKEALAIAEKRREAILKGKNYANNYFEDI